MIHEPFSLAVNDRHQFQLQPTDAQQLDVIHREGTPLYHILEAGQAFQVEVLDTNYHLRTYQLRVNGRIFTVKISDYYDRLVQQMGLNAGGVQKQNNIKAPMPGLVLQVSIEVGQAVQKGDTLLILEAMKMENVLKAAHEGVIKSIQVKQGQAVEKGQLLIEIE
jgi:biotin carboxyl carrier protein